MWFSYEQKISIFCSSNVFVCFCLSQSPLLPLHQQIQWSQNPVQAIETADRKLSSVLIFPDGREVQQRNRSDPLTASYRFYIGRSRRRSNPLNLLPRWNPTYGPRRLFLQFRGIPASSWNPFPPSVWRGIKARRSSVRRCSQTRTATFGRRCPSENLAACTALCRPRWRRTARTRTATTVRCACGRTIMRTYGEVTERILRGCWTFHRMESLSTQTERRSLGKTGNVGP